MISELGKNQSWNDAPREAEKEQHKTRFGPISTRLRYTTSQQPSHEYINFDCKPK